MVDYRNEAIGDYGYMDLNLHGIFRRALELLDFQVLFWPLEEQLHQPAILVEFGHTACHRVSSSPNDKETAHGINPWKTFEIIVVPVKYVVGASFVRDGVHGLHVVHLALRNQQERGNLSFDIKKRMDCDAALCRTELCPLNQFQTEVYSRRVKRIDMSPEPENFLCPFFAGEFNHVVGEIFEDAEIPVFVSLREIAPGYMTTDAEMVAF